MNSTVCWLIFKFCFPVVVVVRPLALEESWVHFTGVVVRNFAMKRMWLGIPPGLLCLWSLVLGFLPYSKMGSLCLLPVGFCGHSACMLRLLVFMANTPVHSPDSVSINVEYCEGSNTFHALFGPNPQVVSPLSSATYCPLLH
jgi:hypothetical protein